MMSKKINLEIHIVMKYRMSLMYAVSNCIINNSIFILGMFSVFWLMNLPA